jgi:HSP20 family molecular chaperone IbpA
LGAGAIANKFVIGLSLLNHYQKKLFSLLSLGCSLLVLIWFDDDFSTRLAKRNWAPALDIQERGGTYLVKADLQGLKNNNIHLELRDGYLRIKRVRSYEHEGKEDYSRRIEGTHGIFQRSM